MRAAVTRVPRGVYALAFIGGPLSRFTVVLSTLVRSAAPFCAFGWLLGLYSDTLPVTSVCMVCSDGADAMPMVQ